jgi:hypothetical protein
VKKIDHTNDDFSDSFYNEVTEDMATDYSTVIDKPMCLKWIETKITGSEYRDLSDMKNDVSSGAVQSMIKHSLTRSLLSL